MSQNSTFQPGTVKQGSEFAGICWNFPFQQIPVPIPAQPYLCQLAETSLQPAGDLWSHGGISSDCKDVLELLNHQRRPVLRPVEEAREGGSKVRLCHRRPAPQLVDLAEVGYELLQHGPRADSTVGHVRLHQGARASPPVRVVWESGWEFPLPLGTSGHLGPPHRPHIPTPPVPCTQRRPLL